MDQKHSKHGKGAHLNLVAFALREIHQISKAQKELNCPIHLLYCPLPLKSISSLRFVDLFNTLKRIFILRLSNVSTTVTNLVPSANHKMENWPNWKAVRIHFWWNATPSYIRSYYTTFLYCRRSSEPYGFRNIAGSQILTLILILGGHGHFGDFPWYALKCCLWRLTTKGTLVLSSSSSFWGGEQWSDS